MPTKINFSLEPFLAETTGEGLVPGVLPHVRDKVRALAEGLEANGALVRFLPCKRSTVENRERRDKGGRGKILTRVNVGVLLHV